MTQRCHRYFSTSNFSIPRPSLVWSHLTSHMRSHMRCHLRLFDIKWGYLISNELIWAQMTSHMSSNDISYELKWHLIWAQMRLIWDSERGGIEQQCVCVSTLITRGVHIEHPHTTNIAGKSKWIWNFKIRFFSHLRSQMRNRSLSVVENRWKNRCYEEKSSFPKIQSYNLYGDQISLSDLRWGARSLIFGKIFLLLNFHIF